jgi:hypothetical protein
MHFALGALDAEHVELAFDVAEDEESTRHWGLRATRSSAILAAPFDYGLSCSPPYR